MEKERGFEKEGTQLIRRPHVNRVIKRQSMG